MNGGGRPPTLSQVSPDRNFQVYCLTGYRLLSTMRLATRTLATLGLGAAVLVLVLSFQVWRSNPMVHGGSKGTLLATKKAADDGEDHDGTVTMPNVASRTYVKGDVTLPPLAIIKNLGHKEAANLYHSYVSNLQTFCGRMARLGLESDGGWEVCEDDVFRPRKPCLVYSFGINNDWSFDDAVADKYGCEVHSFDPSMGLKDHRHAPSISFHATGLAAYNGTSAKEWRMRTLKAILSDLGHLQSTIDILKMDIEESEWTVIPELLATGALDRVKQFLFEMHLSIQPVEPDRTKYINALVLLKALYVAGFRTFFIHRNHWCHFKSKFAPERLSCHELYMIRVPES